MLSYMCDMQCPCGSTLNYKMGRTGQGHAERPMLSYMCDMQCPCGSTLNYKMGRT